MSCLVEERSSELSGEKMTMAWAMNSTKARVMSEGCQEKRSLPGLARYSRPPVRPRVRKWTTMAGAAAQLVTAKRMLGLHC